MTFIDFLTYLILGLVQGFTEILPVSSSGHLVLFQTIFGITLPNMTFEIIVNTGSLIAIIAFYWQDIKQILFEFFAYTIKRNPDHKASFVYAWLLALASIPIGISGFIMRNRMDAFKSPLYVAIALLVTGTLLLSIHYFGRENDRKNVSVLDSITMGLAQGLAIFPGISRSGATISGGLARKLDIKTTLRFSFLLYIPASLGAMALSFSDITQAQSDIVSPAGYLIAFIASGFATFFALKLLIKMVKKSQLHYFGFYVLTVALIVFILEVL